MTNKEKEIHALKTLFERYLTIVSKNKLILEGLALPERCSYESLTNLLNEAINNTESYPLDKMHRWLGFTQGVLSVIGLIDVDEERDFTRPYLHSYHEQKPKTFG